MKTLLVLAAVIQLAGCAAIPYCRNDPDHERRCAAITAGAVTVGAIAVLATRPSGYGKVGPPTKCPPNAGNACIE